MEPVVSITDCDFIKKMDDWYISTSFKKCWKKQIPTYLSYFVYWCTMTKLKVEVHSLKYAGIYNYASEEFEKYMYNAHKQYFKYGYPISVSNTNGIVMIYQKTFDEMLFYKVIPNPCPINFIKYFNSNIYFQYEDDDDCKYYPGDYHFKEVIEREINQLFLIDSIPYSR